MWASARLGGRAATIESVGLAVDGLIHSQLTSFQFQKDGTAWESLATESSDAVKEYVSQLKPELSTILRLRALTLIDAEVLERGCTYPFVFGRKKTNGLLTALQFALGNVALSLYADGRGEDVCLSVAPPHGSVHWLLTAKVAMDSRLVVPDPIEKYKLFMRVAALCTLACPGSKLANDCLRLVRMQYHPAFISNHSLPLEDALKEELHRVLSTGTPGTTRSGALLLKKIELQRSRAVTVAESAARPVETALHSDLWARADIVLECCSLSRSLKFH